MPKPSSRALAAILASLVAVVAGACSGGGSTGSTTGPGNNDGGDATAGDDGGGSATSSGGTTSSGGSSGASSSSGSSSSSSGSTSSSSSGGSSSGGSSSTSSGGSSSGSSTSGSSASSSGGSDSGSSASSSSSGSSSSGSGSSSGSSSSSSSSSSSGSSGSDSGSGSDAGGPKFDYLVTILMENHNLSQIYGHATYMTQLADANVLLQHYTAVDHPSEPNYQALGCGQTNNPPSGDDAYHQFNVTNIVDRLETAGKTWKVYSESASGACDLSNPDIRHVPFIFYTSVYSSTTRCNKIIPTTAPTDDELVAELNSSTPSNYIWLTPNDTDNMHSASIATGDGYLQNLVPRILGSTTFTTKKAALFIVFDEGNNTFPTDYVYAVWAGPVVKTMQKYTTSYSHYSYLATLEAVWGMPSITTNDSSATPMTQVFK